MCSLEGSDRLYLALRNTPGAIDTFPRTDVPRCLVPIRVQCPSRSCRANCTVDDSVAGRQVKCPKCGNAFLASPTIDGRLSETDRGRSFTRQEPFTSFPTEFGRYQVLKLLGQGGMGAVYLAHDSQLGRDVALKIPFFDVNLSPQRAERFIREARSAAALRHPNICTVFDVGQLGSRAFITMEYIEGTSLEALIDPDEPMSEVRAAEIVRKLAIALEHAHRKGIVHRDLKPANVMLTADGEPVVMDFGLAKRAKDVDASDAKLTSNADVNEAKLTRDGSILGTPSYMSPEQVRGDLSLVGPPTDVYALGVILFEMLTGRPPYVGAIGVILGQVLVAPLPPIREFRPEGDERLEAICLRAMAKNIADRYPSMAALAEALDHYLKQPDLTQTTGVADQSQSIPAIARRSIDPGSSGDKLTVPAASIVEEPKPGPVKATPIKVDGRHPIILIGIAVGVLSLLALLAVVVLRLETSNGTLIVEIDDPEVEAKIKNGSIVLADPDGKKRYTISPTERDKKIDSGTYKIHVEGADGLALDTTEFTLKKGDKVTVRVTLAPKAPRGDGPGPIPLSPEPGPGGLGGGGGPKRPTPGPAAPKSEPVKLGPKARTVSVNLGQWKVEKDELVQSDLNTFDSVLVFGDLEWTDYDFKCEARKIVGYQPGYGEVTQIVRANEGDCYEFTLGKYDGAWQSLCTIAGRGRVARLGEKRTGPLDSSVWYKMEVRVRGDQIECWVDNALAVTGRSQNYAKGGVGLRTWRSQARFRNIQVTDPKGKVLFEGFPDLP